MSQNNTEMQTILDVIAGINRVDGFEPSVFAVDYTDLNTKETRKRLPVIIQIAWFRLLYPKGKIALKTEQKGDVFVSYARIYIDRMDPVEAYLSEATASRGKCEEMPSVSPREWAQTAAIGIALRNAGFGLQFAMAGESFASNAPDEFIPDVNGSSSPFSNGNSNVIAEDKLVVPPEIIPVQPEKEMTLEEKYKVAITIPCPIQKFAGKTLGDVVLLDQGAILWLATKYDKDPVVKSAAQVICDYAAAQVA